MVKNTSSKYVVTKLTNQELTLNMQFILHIQQSNTLQQNSLKDGTSQDVSFFLINYSQKIHTKLVEMSLYNLEYYFTWWYNA